MADTTTTIKRDNYKMTIVSSNGNTLIADEPQNQGGKNLGFSPFELLASSLGACTSATLRMYADRKKLDLDQVVTRVSVQRDDKNDKTSFVRQITLSGNLSPSECERLFEIAEKCPIHRTLSGHIDIETIVD